MALPETARVLLVVPLFLLVPVFAVVLATPGAINDLVDLRAKPTEEGESTTYRVRPSALVPLLLGMIVGPAIVLPIGWAHHFGGWFFASGVAYIGVCLVALVIRCPRRLFLDEQGIHSLKGVGHSTTIRWSNLSHVEKRKLFDETFVYIFRGAEGSAIAASEQFFDSEEILQRIREHHPCPEQPYKKRKWYAG